MDNGDVGQRIAQARAAKGWNQGQLAAAMGVDRTTLAKIETGSRRVTALELVGFARELGRRIEWFVSTPTDAVAQHRAKEGAGLLPIDEKLESVERDVRFLRGLGRLEPSPRPRIFPKPQSLNEAEALGAEIRSLTGSHEGPLHKLTTHCEDLGLLVFAAEVGDDDADAACTVSEGCGVALVNSSRAVGRRRLSAAHELIHYMIDDQYETDFRMETAPASDPHETRVERAARAFLLPAGGVREFWSAHFHEGARAAAVRTASEYRVDMSTLARRLLDLGVVSEATANEVRAVRTRRSDIVEFALHVPHDLEGTFLPPPFARAVLQAYRSEEVTLERALDLMAGTFSEEDFEPRPELATDALWSVL